jgi:hypothetical protein
MGTRKGISKCNKSGLLRIHRLVVTKRENETFKKIGGVGNRIIRD